VESFEGTGGRLERVRLRELVEERPPVVVVGAGFIGCEVAGRCEAVMSRSRLPSATASICDDVARWPHPLAGGELVSVEHWSNAVDVGRVAGRNLVVAPEERTAYTEVPSFWSDQYGLKLQSAGFSDRADRFDVVEGWFAERRFLAAGERDRRLIAVVAMNMVRRLVHFQRFIAERGSLADAQAS
jgi:NADPH-dependent 2,4-dienoyl-CoA reductase/sulfur reductase-like enzyme